MADKREAKLKYTLVQAPSPLSAGEKGAVGIQIDAPEGEEVLCSGIRISVEAGAGSTVLFQDISKIETALSQPEDEYWQLVANMLLQKMESQTYPVILTPIMEELPVMGTAVLTLSGLIADRNGAYEVTIEETLSEETLPAVVKLEGNIGKTVYYFDNLFANLGAGDRNPITMVKRSTPFYLEWESNMDQFLVYWNGEGTRVKENRILIEEGIERDTTFIVAASILNKANGRLKAGRAAAQGNLRTEYHYLTIMVENRKSIGTLERIKIPVLPSYIRSYVPKADGVLQIYASLKDNGEYPEGGVEPGGINMNVSQGERSVSSRASARYVKQENTQLLEVVSGGILFPVIKGESVTLRYDAYGCRISYEVLAYMIPIQ